METNNTNRQAINAMIAEVRARTEPEMAEYNANRIADLEIAREYFNNPEFRAALSRCGWRPLQAALA